MKKRLILSALVCAAISTTTFAVSITVHTNNVSARINPYLPNFLTTTQTNANVNLNDFAQLQYMDPQYNAPVNDGGISFDQYASKVTFQCQQQAWNYVKTTVNIDGNQGVCGKDSTTPITQTYNDKTHIDIFLEYPAN